MGRPFLTTTATPFQMWKSMFMKIACALPKNTSATEMPFRIVLAQRFSRQTDATPLQIYRALRATNPSPYMFLLEFSEDLTLVGASPEMLVRLEDGIAYNRPLAGTRRRGTNEKEDLALEEGTPQRSQRARRTRHVGRPGTE